MKRFLALVMLAVTACASPISSTQSSPTPGAAGSRSVPATPSVSSAAASEMPVTAASGTPGTATSAAGWQPVPIQPALYGVGFTAIARAEQRFVAVGTAGDHALFLDSDDGLTWHRGMDLGTEARVAELAAGPRWFVAVGTISGRPASWASEDGLTWTVRTDPFPMPVLGTDTATVTGVIANSDGWIAVGHEDAECHTGCGLEPVRALVWTSVWTSGGGWEWTLVAGQPALEGGGMDSIARTEAGFVATGIAARHAVTWTSTDGTTWSRGPDAPNLHPQPDTDPAAAVGLGRVLAGHGVVVGLGTAFGVGPGGAPAAVAWWSSDGRTWTTAPVTDASPDYARSVAVTTDGFLATGITVRGNAGFPIVWRSVDGRSWETVPCGSAPDGFDPVAVAATRWVEIAVGSAGTTGPAWWRPVP